MKRILIIEDERLSANRLARLIREIDDTYEIDGPLMDVNQVVDHLSKDNGYDIIFSDIRLESHLVFQAFREVMPSCPVIFTTAYDEYALQAFQNQGVAYLLKPIEMEHLTAAIRKVTQMQAPKESAEQLTAVARELKCYRERILLPSGDELVPVRTSDISYIHAEDGGVTINTSGGRTFSLPSTTLGELEEQLDPEVFFRINRQYLVHIDAFHKIHYFFNGKLTVEIKGCDEHHILISRDKSAQLKRWLDR